MRGVSPSVTVIGAGVVGLAVAFELARRDVPVELVDDGTNSASAAAAGMIAPASEAVLDAADAAFATALLRARERWDAWSERVGLELDRRGALHVAKAAELERRLLAAHTLGFRAVRRPDGLHLADDALLAPARALAVLRKRLRDARVTLRSGRAVVAQERLAIDGRPLEGEVVVAAGWGAAALAGAVPELRELRPIKGQLLHFPGVGEPGPVIRAPDVYLAPQPDGWIAGATMEPGRADLDVDPAALARLQAAAAALRPELVGARGAPAVGVRAASPDGRPLVGRSRSGVWLTTGMRRNGWLLAPLVAEGIAAYLGGADADAALAGQAGAWDPARVFNSERAPS